MDDVRARAERFTASENFKHTAAGLGGERQEKRNHGHREQYPDRPCKGQDRRKSKGPTEERDPKEDTRRPTLRTFARFTPLNAPRARIFELHQSSKLWERPSPVLQDTLQRSAGCSRITWRTLSREGTSRIMSNGITSKREKQEQRRKETLVQNGQKRNQRDRRRPMYS
ncbi:unnamed protein product [Amaranthus hypochondriacus]